MWYLYILKCQKDVLYTGITSNLKRRFQEHKRGEPNFTRNNPAIEIVYQEQFSDKYQAAKREKQIKSWTRKKKWALIQGELELLRKL